MSSASFARRDHVPAELMRDYDHVNGPEVMAFPPAAIDKVRDDEHPVFFSSRHGGFWVLTRTTTSGRRSWTRSCFRSGGEASRRTRLTGCSSRSTSIRRAPPVPQADGAAFLTRPGRQAGTDRPPGGPGPDRGTSRGGRLRVRSRFRPGPAGCAVVRPARPPGDGVLALQPDGDGSDLRAGARPQGAWRRRRQGEAARRQPQDRGLSSGTWFRPGSRSGATTRSASSSGRR